MDTKAAIVDNEERRIFSHNSVIRLSNKPRPRRRKKAPFYLMKISPAESVDVIVDVVKQIFQMQE